MANLIPDVTVGVRRLAGPVLILAAALAALFVLNACVQDPSGTKTSPNESSALQLLSEAEEHYRRGRYDEALAAYDRALALDSSLSQAYVGQTKATISVFGLDRAALVADFEHDFLVPAQDPTRFALLDHSDSVLTLRLQVSKRVRSTLGKLIDRDSLTLWHRYLVEDIPSAEDLSDPLFQARHNFMADYLVQADAGTPGYRKREAFPLSDLKVSALSVAVDYTVFTTVYTVTRLYDLDRNDTIDARDSLMKKLRFGSGGGLSIDSLSSIADGLENDSLAQVDLNALIANMSSGLKDPSHLAGLIGGSGGDPDHDTAGVAPNIDSVVKALGETIYFYQFGDRKDNDGDGCVDEEILDDLDNDLDGFVDEDARIIPANKPDGVDNDRDGRMDPVNPASGLPGTDSAGGEALVGSGLYPAKPHVLGYVHAYLMATNQHALADAQTDWIRIKKGASDADMAVRLAVQKDSLTVRIPAGGPVPDSLKAKLEHAKKAVGGCWRNYP